MSEPTPIFSLVRDCQELVNKITAATDSNEKLRWEIELREKLKQLTRKGTP